MNNHCILDKEFRLEDFSFWFQSVPPIGSSEGALARTTFPFKVQILFSRQNFMIGQHSSCRCQKSAAEVGWPFTFCGPLLWKTRRSIIVCGRGKEAPTSCCCWLENDSSMPLWNPKGTQVINMSRWQPCVWSLTFFIRAPWSCLVVQRLAAPRVQHSPNENAKSESAARNRHSVFFLDFNMIQ
jgi:hypothetical protein